MTRMPLLNLALLLMLFFSADIMMTLKLREDLKNIFEDNCLCCSFIVLLCFKWHGYCCLDISLDCSDKPAYLQTTCQPKTMEAKCIFFSWKPGLEVSLGVGIKVVNAMHQVYHWSPHVCATEEEALNASMTSSTSVTFIIFPGFLYSARGIMCLKMLVAAFEACFVCLQNEYM